MKKFIILVIGICSLFLLSCSKKEVDNIIIGKLPFKTPIVEWGATKDKVKQYMKGYTLYSETNSALLYLGKDTEHSINYQFVSEKLSASSVLLLQSDESNIDFSKIFKNFELLPMLTSGTTGCYLNAKMKTLGTYELHKNTNGNFYSISWIEINNLVEGE